MGEARNKLGDRLLEEVISNMEWRFEDFSDRDFIAFASADAARSAQAEWSKLATIHNREGFEAHNARAYKLNPFHSPHMLLEQQDRLRSLRRDFEAEPKGRALMSALYACAESEIAMPFWVAHNFRERIFDIEFGRVSRNSWDEVFGLPLPKGTHMNRRRRRALAGPHIANAVDQAIRNGSAVGPELFERVGREQGVGKTVAEELYYEYRQYLTPLPRKDKNSREEG